MLCMTNLHDINGQINTGLIWISYNSLQHRSFPTAYNHPWTWGAWCGCPEICPAGGRRSIALLLLFPLPGIFRQMVQGWQRVLQLPPRYIREVVKKRSFNGQADRKGWPPSPPLWSRWYDFSKYVDWSPPPYGQPDRKKTVFYDSPIGKGSKTRVTEFVR